VVSAGGAAGAETLHHAKRKANLRQMKAEMVTSKVTMMKQIFWLLSLMLFGFTSAAKSVEQPIGSTRVATWKDDKKAAFLLMFDDGWPSHFQVALPELAKRNMTATFYIVPNKGEFKAFEKKWKEDFRKQGMVFGNHTMTHDGLQSLEDAEWEFGECTRYINKLENEFSGAKEPRLVSFGKPGVENLKITAEQQLELRENK
jgi:peptidoglycan/xylan/chitin deacetylase (PgdA/CDA1 family)